MVLPNFQPPIALKPCLAPGPSWLRHPHRQADIAVAARRDGAGDDALTLAITLHRRSEFLDHADGFMTDGQTARDRILALEDMNTVPQMVVVVTLISASSGPMSGTVLSSSTIRPGSTNTAAFIFVIAILLRGLLFGYGVARPEALICIISE